MVCDITSKNEKKSTNTCCDMKISCKKIIASRVGDITRFILKSVPIDKNLKNAFFLFLRINNEKIHVIKISDENVDLNVPVFIEYYLDEFVEKKYSEYVMEWNTFEVGQGMSKNNPIVIQLVKKEKNNKNNKNVIETLQDISSAIKILQ